MLYTSKQCKWCLKEQQSLVVLCSHIISMPKSQEQTSLHQAIISFRINHSLYVPSFFNQLVIWPHKLGFCPIPISLSLLKGIDVPFGQTHRPRLLLSFSGDPPLSPLPLLGFHASIYYCLLFIHHSHAWRHSLHIMKCFPHRKPLGSRSSPSRHVSV